MSCTRFLAMIATSTFVMFLLMYTTVYSASHVWFSQTRSWMALYMGATMAVIMLAIVRDQTTVEDVSWMKAMTPRHSIAILTSERADLSDERVQELAEQIIATQREEIAETERLIAELEQG